MKAAIILFFSILSLSSCENLGKKQIVGKYFLDSDGGQGYQLNYTVNDDGDYLILVDCCIDSLGQDSSYIVVKRHEKSDVRFGVYKNDFFYIVPKYKGDTFNPQQGIIGPLNIYGFNAKKSELHISQIRFTIP
jgi:hypothetical protein